MDAATQEKLSHIEAKLDVLTSQMAYLVERQKKTEELFAEATPILREVMNVATHKLDDLDKRGYFLFGSELLSVGERIVEGFTPDDVRQLGDAVVSILETVRAMTQPEVLQIAGEDAVALGSDWDGFVQPTRGLGSPAELPNLTEALLRAGVSAQVVHKILGDNVLRVLEAVPPRLPT